MARNTPTPAETATINSVVSIEGVYEARTCKSGSEAVTMNPTNTASSMTSHILRDFAISEPTYSPIRDMEPSAPSENRPVPTIMNTAPTKNEMNK